MFKTLNFYRFIIPVKYGHESIQDIHAFVQNFFNNAECLLSENPLLTSDRFHLEMVIDWDKKNDPSAFQGIIDAMKESVSNIPAGVSVSFVPGQGSYGSSMVFMLESVRDFMTHTVKIGDITVAADTINVTVGDLSDDFFENRVMEQALGHGTQQARNNVLFFDRFTFGGSDDSSWYRKLGRRFISFLFFSRFRSGWNAIRAWELRDCTLSYRIYPAWIFNHYCLGSLLKHLKNKSPFETQLILYMYVVALTGWDAIWYHGFKYTSSRSTLRFKNIIDVFKLYLKGNINFQQESKHEKLEEVES